MPLEVPQLPGGNPQLQKAMAKIVELEQKNIQKVDEKIAKVDNKLGLLRDLKNKFTGVRDAVKPFASVYDFRDLTATSSHPDIVSTSSVDKEKAKPGSYEIEVKELANSASLMTTGVKDPKTTEVGVGYISFTTPEGEEKDIYINSANNTLQGIANSINNSDMGVRAQVVNDGTDSDRPWRLILSGEKQGWKNNFDWAEFNFLDGDFELDHYRSREGKSAIINLNGQPLYVDENSVKDLIPGVVFNLNQARPGQTVKVEIKPDFEKIEGKAKNFVDKLNEVFTFIQNQNSVGQHSQKDPSKALSGDTALQSLQSRLTSMIQTTVANTDAATVRRLQDVGITFNRTGTLDYDGEKFQSALENRFEEVAALFVGDTPLSGFARKLTKMVDGFTRSRDGFLTIKEQGFQDNIERLERKKEQTTEKAEKKIERSKIQFAKAEAAIEQMKNMRNQFGNASLMPG